RSNRENNRLRERGFETILTTQLRADPFQFALPVASSSFHKCLPKILRFQYSRRGLDNHVMQKIGFRLGAVSIHQKVDLDLIEFRNYCRSTLFYADEPFENAGL